MNQISLLKNTIQEYAWGSRSAISELLGEPAPSEKPQAELWMGAHPKAPSYIQVNGKWVSLISIIEDQPKQILGNTVADKFGGRLPYLFKVLAATQPLSIQAHPNLEQAKEGFERENVARIPFDAPHRNYKDDMHKPEIICALTPFWALNGFCKIDDILTNMNRCCPTELSVEIVELQDQPEAEGLKGFFEAIMTMESDRKQRVIQEVVTTARQGDRNDTVLKWILSLYKAYPTDIGVLSPLYLNLICLSPGEAMLLPAGQLHAYLDGLGMELMANSDNVLRGGLTPKHVDVPELLKTLLFEEKAIEILNPEEQPNGEKVYASPAEEFVLSIINVNEDRSYKSPMNRSVEILFCNEGKGNIKDLARNEATLFTKGTAIMIPAAVEQYIIEGGATLYKAASPL